MTSWLGGVKKCSSSEKRVGKLRDFQTGNRVLRQLKLTNTILIQGARLPKKAEGYLVQPKPGQSMPEILPGPIVEAGRFETRFIPQHFHIHLHQWYMALSSVQNGPLKKGRDVHKGSFTRP